MFTHITWYGAENALSIYGTLLTFKQGLAKGKGKDNRSFAKQDQGMQFFELNFFLFHYSFIIIMFFILPLL